MTPLARQLRHAIDTRGLTMRQLGDMTNLDPQTISNAARGVSLPTFQTVARLAEALEWPLLLQLVAADRKRRCKVCRQQFVTTHYRPDVRRFCSKKCQQVAWFRTRNHRSHDVASTRLRAAQTAIEEFCNWHEPEGVCREADCPLRPFSPLPLVPLNGMRRPTRGVA
jgi:hypothetical protein